MTAVDCTDLRVTERTQNKYMEGETEVRLSTIEAFTDVGTVKGNFSFSDLDSLLPVKYFQFSLFCVLPTSMFIRGYVYELKSSIC